MVKRLPVVIFGERNFSSALHYHLTQDSNRDVVGFTVDAAFQRKELHEGLIVVPFEEIERHFPPSSCELLIPIGWGEINGIRKARCERAREKGYRLTSYVANTASLSGTIINENTMVFENVIVQPNVTLGENIILRSGVIVGHHGRIDDHCFVASGVTMGGAVHVSERCFIGLGAVLRDNIRIAPRCFIGAGAVVLSDTEADGVYVGNPAKRLEKSSLAVTAAS